MANSLLELYNATASPTVLAAKSLGTTANQGRGVNFFDGQKRGPWNKDSTGVDDVWQDNFKENAQGTKITPAATNNGSYPLSRWSADALKIAFDGKGPPQLSNGSYWRNSRFTKFSDTAGRNFNTELHRYAPKQDKKYADLSFDKDNTRWANLRINARAFSTSVRGITGAIQHD
jgi:hypothetical protein